jgi:hypothetical protein
MNKMTRLHMNYIKKMFENHGFKCKTHPQRDRLSFPNVGCLKVKNSQGTIDIRTCFGYSGYSGSYPGGDEGSIALRFKEYFNDLKIDDIYLEGDDLSDPHAYEWIIELIKTATRLDDIIKARKA